MTWTYSGDPTASSNDAVRFTIGDTNSSDQQLSDEEIGYLLSAHGSVLGASIAACDALVARHATAGTGIDRQVGDLRISGSQRAASFASMRDRLVRQQAVSAVPLAGGISVADKQATEDDTDRPSPSFSRGQFDAFDNPAPGGRAVSDSDYDYGD